MFLTRFQINPRRRDSGKLFSSPQVMHAAVLSSFPDAEASPGSAGRVLWRLDNSGDKLLLIIASPRKPDLTHLVEQVGWPSLEPAWETRNYTPLLDRLTAGQRWAFRLTANPIYSLPPVEGKRGRVVGHRTVEHQLGWLESRAERHGFSVVAHEAEQLNAATEQPVPVTVSTARVTSSQVLRFARGSNTVTLRTATFDGLLDVVNVEMFRDALSNGIGSGKAYGCGLLTIAPCIAIAPDASVASVLS